MAGKMSSEVLAIQNLRQRYPFMSQTRLAKRILATQWGETIGRYTPFYSTESVTLAKNAGTRTFYSIYSVIRRYDAQQKRNLAAVS